MEIGLVMQHTLSDIYSAGEENSTSDQRDVERQISIFLNNWWMRFRPEPSVFQKCKWMYQVSGSHPGMIWPPGRHPQCVQTWLVVTAWGCAPLTFKGREARNRAEQPTVDRVVHDKRTAPTCE